MEYDEVNRLLERYWNAESSPEEERRLKGYFASGRVFPEHAHLGALFGFYSELEGKQTGEDFTAGLNLRIGTGDPVRIYRKRPKPGIWLRIAASIVLLILIGFLYRNLARVSEQETQRGRPELAMADTYRDPGQALKAVQDALLTVSRKMDQGRELTRKGVSKLDDISRVMK